MQFFGDNTRVRVAYECVITRKLHEIPYGTYTTGTRSVTLFSHVENDNKSTNLFKINTVFGPVFEAHATGNVLVTYRVA